MVQPPVGTTPPTPGLKRNAAGIIRIVVEPASSSPVPDSRIVGPVSVVKLLVPASSAEIASPPVAGITPAARTLVTGTTEPERAISNPAASTRPRRPRPSTAIRRSPCDVDAPAELGAPRKELDRVAVRGY